MKPVVTATTRSRMPKMFHPLTRLMERDQFHIGDQRPSDVAMQILAGVQGTLLMGRLTGDPHVIDTVADELRSYLGSARDLPTC